MALHKSLRSRDIEPANDVVVRQSDTDTVVSAESKTFGKSTEYRYEMRLKLYQSVCGPSCMV